MYLILYTSAYFMYGIDILYLLIVIFSYLIHVLSRIIFVIYPIYCVHVPMKSQDRSLKDHKFSFQIIRPDPLVLTGRVIEK